MSEDVHQSQCTGQEKMIKRREGSILFLEGYVNQCKITFFYIMYIHTDYANIAGSNMFSLLFILFSLLPIINLNNIHRYHHVQLFGFQFRYIQHLPGVE